MFSFRRKPKQQPPPTSIRTSPSLPELNSQGIPWPENLIDIDAIRESPPPPEVEMKREQVGNAGEKGAISAMYMSQNGPRSFEPRKPQQAPLTGKYSQRRARIPPTFNLMVVGGKGTGKTSLLRLLLETADISPTATVDQKAALDIFLKGPPKTTQSIQTACVEICESRFDRVLFSVIDTPGLDFQEGRELKLERQVNSVIKYVDQQYADTMSEESKVVRQNKGDQHIHLCIYMIDPSSIISSEQRRSQSSFPARTRSETTIAQQPPDLVPDTSSEDSEDEEILTMSPTEIRVIRRIAAKSNVLPVVARADSLTDDKLQAIKKAIRSGLSDAGIDFGVFVPEELKITNEPPARKRKTQFSVGPGNDDAAHEQDASEDGALDADEKQNGVEGGDEGPSGAVDEERKARPVIKLRPKRHGRPLSRSRSRRDLSQIAEDDRRPLTPDSNDPESVANVRFSAHIVATPDLPLLLPFALIAPEPGKRRPRATSPTSIEYNSAVSPVQPTEEPAPPQSPDSHVPIPPTPSSVHSIRNLPYLGGPPDDLKGVFVRRYRWGTVDVLDPQHCDFAAMRTAVLSTHLKLLKIRTKEVLYEKYRTEKLLARRATAQISEEQRQRLLEDLGL
ncbi:hypothetical protein FA15DRAFT_635350 [Coprinopsis marcescibilis]|uniref:Septin-type G domain-containing protein n=1 Tax=Coprinopsis marcescibilis TaxID=230819 RepID=A0A5C3L4I8_COPMA|nr:hypothetical protein FA15DRAFT_635350 [Coprinopsis marcescibilis]